MFGTIIRGTTVNAFHILLWEDEAKTQPVNLSGYVARMDVRAGGKEGQVVKSLALTISTPNRIDIAEWKADYKAGKYFTDLRLESAAGAESTYLQSEFTITQNITD
jgi:hypothetical protein